jgi:hypothetical protein
VLSDSARPYSGAPESTCSYGGAFRMQRDLTYIVVVLVQSRRMSLRGETGPFTECTLGEYSTCIYAHACLRTQLAISS